MYTYDWFLEQARQGNMFHAASTGAVTLSTVSATCTGLVLTNPYGSGKWLVVRKVRFAPSTAPAGAAPVGLALSPAISQTAVTHTTPMVVFNALSYGSNVNTGVGLVDSAATLPAAPVWFRPLGGPVAGSSITPTPIVDNTDGDIILLPGTNLSLSYLTTAAVGLASITWVEILPNT